MLLSALECRGGKVFATKRSSHLLIRSSGRAAVRFFLEFISSIFGEFLIAGSVNLSAGIDSVLIQ